MAQVEAEPQALPLPAATPSLSSAFAELLERIEDWKGHKPRNFGTLLSYRPRIALTHAGVDDTFVNARPPRVYDVYVFERIFLVVNPEPRKSGRVVRRIRVRKQGPEYPPWRLMGRIFFRNVRSVRREQSGRVEVIWDNGDEGDQYVNLLADEADEELYRALRRQMHAERIQVGLRRVAAEGIKPEDVLSGRL